MKHQINQPDARLGARFVLPLLPIVLSVLVVWKFSGPLGITADGHTYLQIARNIQLGVGLGWQALWAAPLPSLLIACTDSLLGIHDLLRTAGLLSSVMGVLLTASVYFLADGLLGRRTALAAALVTAVTPHVLLITFSTEPEIYYTVFLVTALGLLDRAVSRNSLAYACGAGCMFCCAYLSRSEGFLIMALVAMALFASQGRRIFRTSLPRIIAATVVVFFLAASPYLLFLKHSYGTFVISPKATYVLIWMKGKIYKDHDKGEQGNDELWGLTPDGRLKWQTPSGVGNLLRYLLKDPQKSARVYARNLQMEVPGRIPNNSGTLHFPSVFPVYLALFAALSFIFSWGESSLRRKITIAAPFLILFILPVFTEGWWKYLVPYAPFLVILACAGLIFTADAVTEHLRVNSGVLANIAVGVCILTLMTYDIDTYSGGAVSRIAARASGPPETADPNRAARLNYGEEARKAGQWAAARYGAGKNYMVPWNKMIYYLNGLWTALPVATPRECFEYARRNRVDILVLEIPNPGIPDSDLATIAPGFSLDAVYHSASSPYRVAFYRPLYLN